MSGEPRYDRSQRTILTLGAGSETPALIEVDELTGDWIVLRGRVP